MAAAAAERGLRGPAWPRGAGRCIPPAEPRRWCNGSGRCLLAALCGAPKRGGRESEREARGPGRAAGPGLGGTMQVRRKGAAGLDRDQKTGAGPGGGARHGVLREKARAGAAALPHVALQGASLCGATHPSPAGAAPIMSGRLWRRRGWEGAPSCAGGSWALAEAAPRRRPYVVTLLPLSHLRAIRDWSMPGAQHRGAPNAGRI